MAADATGVLSSYGLNGGVPISIDAIIDLIDPLDLPLQNGYVLGGAPALSNIPIDNKKIEWQDDTLLDAVSTINEGGEYGISDVTLTATDGTRFKAGDVLYIEDEALYVSSVSTNNLTVIRAFAGTTAAAHADGKDIICIGQALPEGNDAIEASHVDRDRRQNFTQIFGPRKVQATGTEQVMPKYGLVRGGEMLYQFDKEMIELAKMVERALIYGTRYDDAVDQRTMGGFMYYISTNENSTGTALTEDLIGDQIAAMYNAGSTPGQGFTMALNLANKRVLNALGTVEVQRADNGRGTIVDYMDFDVGRVMFVVSRYMRNSDAIMYTADQCALATLRGWRAEPLAKTGDADSLMAVAELSFRLKRQKYAAKFTGLTTT